MKKINLLLIISFIILGAASILTLQPQAQYSTINYSEQGGSSWVIGSGGALTIEDTTTAAAGLIYESSRVLIGSYYGDPGGLVGTATMAGLDESDTIFATLNSVVGTTYIKAVVPYSGTAVIHFASDPGGVVRASLWALED